MRCPSCGDENREGTRFCDSCGAELVARETERERPAAEVLPSDVPAELARGRYRVRSFLGQGSRKRVYLAEDSASGSEVAVALFDTEGERAEQPLAQQYYARRPRPPHGHPRRPARLMRPQPVLADLEGGAGRGLRGGRERSVRRARDRGRDPVGLRAAGQWRFRRGRRQRRKWRHSAQRHRHRVGIRLHGAVHERGLSGRGPGPDDHGAELDLPRRQLRHRRPGRRQPHRLRRDRPLDHVGPELGDPPRRDHQRGPADPDAAVRERDRLPPARRLADGQRRRRGCRPQRDRPGRAGAHRRLALRHRRRRVRPPGPAGGPPAARRQEEEGQEGQEAQGEGIRQEEVQEAKGQEAPAAPKGQEAPAAPIRASS
ncbi:MAG: zinc ribbon domain-containing protein [Actinobacteria bacterium]|nr:zinc ribbon domain-containing protein [Actinomycetota bacterium]